MVEKNSLDDEKKKSSLETLSEGFELVCKPCNFLCFSKREFEEHNEKVAHMIKDDVSNCFLKFIIFMHDYDP